MEDGEALRARLPLDPPRGPAPPCARESVRGWVWLMTALSGFVFWLPLWSSLRCDEPYRRTLGRRSSSSRARPRCTCSAVRWCWACATRCGGCSDPSVCSFLLMALNDARAVRKLGSCESSRIGVLRSASMGPRPGYAPELQRFLFRDRTRRRWSGESCRSRTVDDHHLVLARSGSWPRSGPPPRDTAQRRRN